VGTAGSQVKVDEDEKPRSRAKKKKEMAFLDRKTAFLVAKE